MECRVVIRSIFANACSGCGRDALTVDDTNDAGGEEEEGGQIHCVICLRLLPLLLDAELTVAYAG